MEFLKNFLGFQIQKIMAKIITPGRYRKVHVVRTKTTTSLVNSLPIFAAKKYTKNCLRSFYLEKNMEKKHRTTLFCMGLVMKKKPCTKIQTGDYFWSSNIIFAFN